MNIKNESKEIRNTNTVYSIRKSCGFKAECCPMNGKEERVNIENFFTVSNDSMIFHND
jgi:hypothetical protein